MSYSGSNAHELTARLLAALDPSYDVLDVHAVNEIISVLEKIHITKELLETTRLGKHVNLLRRRTRDPSLARRAKVLVKRWRDLVIPGSLQQRPTHHGHTNRTSAERQLRPHTSPALSRVVSPAVPSPRSSSRPGWSGYDSDSQDVILVDDEPSPAPPPAAPAPGCSPPQPAFAPAPLAAAAHAEPPRAKRDKKPKKKRGHSRAGSESAAAGAAPWGGCNGASPPAAAPARRNGCRKPQLDAYATLIHKMPPAGSKKVKTTQELLEAIQARGPALSPAPASPSSPDVQLIESPVPPEYAGEATPLRNGGESPRASPPPRAPPTPPPPHEEEELYPVCTCGEEEAAGCEAARGAPARPLHVHALHHARVPGVNGTRAPPAPHPHAVRAPAAAGAPGLFASVVPLYRYLDYADDYCAKNLSRVDLCPWLRRDEFAPSPPPPPPAPSPPPPRPYPLDAAAGDRVGPGEADVSMESDGEQTDVPVEEAARGGRSFADDVSMKSDGEQTDVDGTKLLDSEINDKPDSLGTNSPEERLRPPDEAAPESPSPADDASSDGAAKEGGERPRGHRTVERAKVELDGRALHACCERARAAAPLSYALAFAAPVLPLSADEELMEEAFARAEADTRRDELGRPERAAAFAEWHEAARLTADLVALPYVVID